MDTIKKNIIERFLTPYYRFSSVNIITGVIADIQKRSWFPCSYDLKTNVLTMDINDTIKIDIKFIWEQSDKENNGMTMYVLKRFE